MDIYGEEVLDHAEHPRNQGSFDDAQDKEVVEGRDANASCGDILEFQLKIEGGIIVKVKWKGEGCAISTAAASKLSEWLKGKTLENIRKLGEKEIVEKAIGFAVNPGREKCLTLSVRVVKKLVG